MEITSRIMFVKLKLFIPIFLLQLLHAEVFPHYCPTTCQCQFDYMTIVDNEALCLTGNSSVSFSWENYKGNAKLEVNCKGAHYNCSDMPQFDIKSGISMMTVKFCSPTIFRCANKFHTDPCLVSTLYLKESIGTYTKDDIAFLDTLWVNNLSIEEAEDDSASRLPAGVFNDVNTLVSLKLKGNVFENTTVTPDVFNALYLLKNLRLNSNKLTSIDPDTFSALTDLETLTIRRNMLQFLPNKLFDSLENLNKIIIVNNLVNMTLDNNAFARLPRWFEDIHIENSKITELPKDVFSNSSSLTTITFKNNSIEVLPSKIFWTTSSLTQIDFSYNQIKVFPAEIFSKLNMLSKVDFSYNNIETLNRDLFSFNTALEQVYLQNNKIRDIDLNVFKKTELQTLSLASNRLERVVGRPSFTWKLRKLILSDNNLNEFEDWILDLIDLEYLDLSSNKINKIKESFIYTWYYIEIDLRNNNITNIEKTNTDMPQSLTIYRNISVYLSNNPLECDCISNVIIKSWYDSGWVADFEDIVCRNGDKLSKINVYQQCNSGHDLLVSIGKKVIGGLVLIIIFVSLCARRKQIWEYINDICNRDTNNSIENEERQEAIKHYDIFISFAHQDGEFVADILLPKLENEYDQKVCVHYRDWIVGELIPNQIVQSVENSTRTILIVSKHFLISEWSQLEFRTAYNLGEQEGRSRIIVIIVDKAILKEANLDKDLKSYIALNTYLLWSDPNFWQKLRNVLPKSRKYRSRRR